MTDYYDDTAYDSRKHSFITTDIDDERRKKFRAIDDNPECNEYIASDTVSDPTSWHDNLDKKKRMFYTKNEVARENARHEKYFVKLVGDGAFFFFSLCCDVLFRSDIYTNTHDFICLHSWRH